MHGSIDKNSFFYQYRQELQDPVLFINKYMLTLFVWQEEHIKNIERNGNTSFILAPRRIGKTTLLSAYAAWFMLCNSNVTLHITMFNSASYTALLENIKHMIRLTPFGADMTYRGTEDYIKLINGSSIRIVSNVYDQIGYKKADLHLFDEPAHSRNFENIYSRIDHSSTMVLLVGNASNTQTYAYKVWESVDEHSKSIVPAERIFGAERLNTIKEQLTQKEFSQYYMNEWVS